MLAQNLHYNYYYPKPKYLILGYLDPLGKLCLGSLGHGTNGCGKHHGPCLTVMLADRWPGRKGPAKNLEPETPTTELAIGA